MCKNKSKHQKRVARTKARKERQEWIKNGKKEDKKMNKKLAANYEELQAMKEFKETMQKMGVPIMAHRTFVTSDGVEMQAYVMDSMEEIIEKAAEIMLASQLLNANMLQFRLPGSGEKIEMSDEEIAWEFNAEFFLGEESWYRDNGGIYGTRLVKENDKWRGWSVTASEGLIDLVEKKASELLIDMTSNKQLFVA